MRQSDLNISDNVKYLSINQIAQDPKYPFSIGQLRHYMMHRHKNCLDNAVRKIGKRLFVRMDRFDAWIEKQIGGQ